MERRLMQYEFRAAKTADGKMTVGGYAARYNQLSHSLGGQFRERITRGAFKKILRSNPDCVALINHDANKPLGRTTARTLVLDEDDNGLKFTCDLPNTSYARDLYESVKRGDINGCSFAFSLGDADQSWAEEYEAETNSKIAVRTILNFAELVDISLVTYPAYPNTNVDARKLAGEFVEARTLELAKRAGQPVHFGPSRLDKRGVPTNISVNEFLDQHKRSVAAVVARRKSLLNSLL